ncbi:MAG: DUF2125 domain-containing protein [Methylovirgula sp.]
MSVGVAQMPRKPLSFRPWLFLLVGLVLFVALVWTIVWHVVAQQSASSLDAWIAREKAFNRSWTCPDRQVDGFPFTIEITCSKPHFDGNIFGRHYSGSLSGFVANAKFTRPNDVRVHVASPFAVLSDDKRVALTLSWDQLDILLAGLPQNMATISITGQALSLQGHAQGLNPLRGHASRVTATFARAAGRRDHTYNFNVFLDGASSPAVDTYFGTAAPADFAAEGDITQARFDPGRVPADSLNRWQAAGGHVDLTRLTVTRGAMKFSANGILTVDATHRLQGQLDTRCVGFEPILRRLGVNPALITAGSLLSSLLGGRRHTAPAAGPQPLHLPIGFNGGRLNVGPIRTSLRLPPVY